MPTDPQANIFLQADLETGAAGFRGHEDGGVLVNLFSDLKRHDMGEELAESFGNELDSEFITARLWGVADTAPYLHDGRALTLTDAIVAHGGEAAESSEAFRSLAAADKEALLAFLRTFRTPMTPAADLTP